MGHPLDRPGKLRWAREAARARARLYPSTFFYTAYALLVMAFALRGPRPATAVAFFAGGVVTWTVVEYLVHRYILHGRFPDGPGLVRHFLHVRFDALHWEHHARPWDAEHINGTIRDTLPFAVGLVLLAAFFPFPTAPVLVAAILQSYVVEEWVHHSVHFYHFRNPYFRYIKRHHLYHHSLIGAGVGYGLTSGLWDIFGRTRIPTEMRRALYRSRRVRRRKPKAQRCPWRAALSSPCSSPSSPAP